MGASYWRDSLQRCRLVCHHLGCRQQQSSPPCSFHLPGWLQNPHETNMVIIYYRIGISLFFLQCVCMNPAPN